VLTPLVKNVDGQSGVNPDTIGWIFEALLTLRVAVARVGSRFEIAPSTERKRTGSFFTPPPLLREVVSSALAPWHNTGSKELLELRICDPAMGGGAFLLEVARQLQALLSRNSRARAEHLRQDIVQRCIYGVDIDPWAVAVTEASLWLFVADPALSPALMAANLRTGDALLDADDLKADWNAARINNEPVSHDDGFDWGREFPSTTGHGFDAVVGNPPWVAYAGRAAQPLSPSRRRDLARRYSAMRGYPTLHGLFAQRAAWLAPQGVLALLMPSPVADLDGYRAVRKAVTERHRVREPLMEFGQDAFEGVTQPCFALVADPDSQAGSTDRPWLLSERTRRGVEAQTLEVPCSLKLMATAEPFPSALFGEMGFQSNRAVTSSLLRRASEPTGPFRYPLREGRDVREFYEGPVRLYLRDEPEAIRAARCRIRPRADYARVRFVVRQTARMPIAALHDGMPFRNTLLAGFDHPDIPPDLVVGLLNSALYRALHLALRRDARQATFPQVKVTHLRALPRPPLNRSLTKAIAELTRRATTSGVDAELRAELDRLVFDLFAIPDHHRMGILHFLRQRSGVPG
jgi:hypothetical protein